MTSKSQQSESNSDVTLTWVDGGFLTDSLIFTPSGTTRVDELSVGDSVCALNPETGLMKPKSILGLEQSNPEEPLVAIESRRAKLHVSPSQPIYYCTKAIDRPRKIPAGRLNERRWYKFLNEWRLQPGEQLGTVDITNLTDKYEARVYSEVHGNRLRQSFPEECDPVRQNYHSGYYFDSQTFKRHQETLENLADTLEICGGPNARGRPYTFDGNDFIELLGWFITEGSINRPQRKNTATVSIAQHPGEDSKSIAELFDRLGIQVYASGQDFQFSSTVYGDLLERLCGLRSHDRRLPWFVWNLSLEQKQLLLDTLIAGDGNDNGTYYTASEQLARGVLRLALHVGIKPRYTNRRGVWQIYLNRTNDGFQSQKHVSRLTATSPLVSLTVEDYPAVLAGMDGKFQWVGVSRVH